MRAKVTAAPINEDDRTVDMTVEVYEDNGTLIQTDTILIPADIFTRDLSNKRIKEHLTRVIASRSDFPVTQAQVDEAVVGMQVVVEE